MQANLVDTCDAFYRLQSNGLDACCHSERIHQAEFDHLGRRAAILTIDRVVSVYTRVTPDQGWHKTGQFSIPGGLAWKLKWSHFKFGQVIATASYDGSIYLHEEKNDRNSKTLHFDDDLTDVHGDPVPREWVRRVQLVNTPISTVTDMKFCHQFFGLMLGACNLRGEIIIYEWSNPRDLEAWQLVMKIPVFKGRCRAFSFSTDRFNSLLVAACTDEKGHPSQQLVIFPFVRTCEEGAEIPEIRDIPISAKLSTPAVPMDIAFSPTGAYSFHRLAVAVGNCVVMYHITCVNEENMTTSIKDITEATVIRVDDEETGAPQPSLEAFKIDEENAEEEIALAAAAAKEAEEEEEGVKKEDDDIEGIDASEASSSRQDDGTQSQGDDEESESVPSSAKSQPIPITGAVVESPVETPVPEIAEEVSTSGARKISPQEISVLEENVGSPYLSAREEGAPPAAGDDSDADTDVTEASTKQARAIAGLSPSSAEGDDQVSDESIETSLSSDGEHADNETPDVGDKFNFDDENEYEDEDDTGDVDDLAHSKTALRNRFFDDLCSEQATDTGYEPASPPDSKTATAIDYQYLPQTLTDYDVAQSKVRGIDGQLATLTDEAEISDISKLRIVALRQSILRGGRSQAKKVSFNHTGTLLTVVYSDGKTRIWSRASPVTWKCASVIPAPETKNQISIRTDSSTLVYE